MSFQANMIRVLLRLALRSAAEQESLQALRARSRKMGAWIKPPSGTVVHPARVGGVPGEWVATDGVDMQRVLLYLHGGAYVVGSASTHRPLVARLGECGGMRALAVDYRLAPEHPFPAAVDDAVAAYRGLLEYGFEPSKIIIGGDSAGGGLALAAMLALREAGDPLPAGAVGICPWFDLAGTGASYRARARLDCVNQPDPLLKKATLYAGGENLTHPLLSPLYADLSDLPPLLLHAASDDILLDDALRLADRISAAGGTVELKVWANLFHVFHLLARYLPEARRATAEIGAFMSAMAGAREAQSETQGEG